jgi:hypothetical protein
MSLDFEFDEEPQIEELPKSELSTDDLQNLDQIEEDDIEILNEEETDVKVDFDKEENALLDSIELPSSEEIEEEFEEEVLF